MHHIIEARGEMEQFPKSVRRMIKQIKLTSHKHTIHFFLQKIYCLIIKQRFFVQAHI